MTNFDPYYVWLGIPPKHQPPDYYRLLGLERFESDPRVIESAADRQMAHIKTFQTGKNAADSQRLLSELAQARSCLLTADEKAAYDRMLRGEPAAAAPLGPPPLAAPPLPIARLLTPTDTGPREAPPASFAVREPKERPSGETSVLLFAGIAGTLAVGIIGVIVVVALSQSGSGPQTNVPPKLPITRPPGEKVVPSKVLKKEPGGETKTEVAEETTTIGEKSSAEKVEPTSKAATAETPGAAKSATTSTAPALPPPVLAGPPVDVLALLPPHPLAAGGLLPGRLDMVNGSLEGTHGCVMLPVETPREYQLDLTVERLVGERPFVVGIVVDGHQTGVVIDWKLDDGARVTGLHLLDHLGADRNESTTKGAVFLSGEPCQLRCIVRSSEVQLLVNGSSFLQWTGDPARLNLSYDWGVPDKNALFVGGMGTFRVSRLQLTAFSSTQASKADPRFELAIGGRAPVPTGEELKAAEAKMRGLIGREITAAKTPVARLALAERLISRAREMQDELPVRYAILQEAEDQAKKGHSSALACEVVAELGKAFDVDTLELQTTAIEAVTKDHIMTTLKIPSLDLKSTAATASYYLEKSFAAGRWDLAVRLAGALRKMADCEGSEALKAYSADRANHVVFSKELYDAMLPVRSQIGDGPEHAAANLAVGRYDCFVRGNWKEGLLLLAHGSDAALVEVAKLELAADFRTYKSVADAWWKLSEQSQEPWRSQFRKQAKYWYEHALTQLSPAERTGVRARAESVSGFPRNRLSPGLIAAYYQGENRDILRATRIEHRVESKWGLGSPSRIVPADHFTAVWRGWIQAPLPGKYRLVVDSDDGTTLELNGKPLWDDLGGSPAKREAIVELTAEPQPIALHLREYIGPAHVSLRWGLAESSVNLAVDQISLFHDPLLAAEMHAREVVGDYLETMRCPAAPGGELLAIFEDQSDFGFALSEGEGFLDLEKRDVFSGQVAARIATDQRFGHISGLRVRIRKDPAPGEYRYLRLAWKKVGGKETGVQLLWNSKPGDPQHSDWVRFHIGPRETFFDGRSIRIGEQLPADWTVVTRDLAADYGDFDLTGIALTPKDGLYGLFDHIYLARTKEDFERLGSPIPSSTTSK